MRLAHNLIQSKKVLTIGIPSKGNAVDGNCSWRIDMAKSRFSIVDPLAKETSSKPSPEGKHLDESREKKV